MIPTYLVGGIMPKTKKNIQVDTLVYLVQDYAQTVCGVHSTLLRASVQYEQVLAEGLNQEERQSLIEEYGENFHDELEYPACIVVYKVDATCVWSYDTINEVHAALRDGEKYE